MKYKKGDRVKVVKVILSFSSSDRVIKRYEKMHLGQKGEIVEVNENVSYPYNVEFENDIDDDTFKEKELVKTDKQLKIE